MKRKFRSFSKDTRGASTLLVAGGIFALLTAVGLVIDLGHLYVVKQELQNAADAGASAGAMALYWLGTSTEPLDAKQLLSCDYAHLKAMEAVNKNRSDNKYLFIPWRDVEVGVWQYNEAKGAWEFETLPCDPENAYNINAVRVTTRRTQAVNGPVSLIFARLLGINHVELTARATAMLGWVRELRPGAGFPIAVGDNYVPPPGQKLWVTFSPDHSDVGGWHAFKLDSCNANVTRALIDGSWTHPKYNIDPSDLAIKVGDYITMQNGVADSVLQHLRKEFYQVHGGQWTVILPVIPGSQTYNQEREVLGFVAFEIVHVDPKNTKSVSGWVRGGYIAPGTDTGAPTGGSTLALRASHPKLVQ